MFNPENDRILYGKAFEHSDEYELEYACGFTYSLDLPVLLMSMALLELNTTELEDPSRLHSLSKYAAILNISKKISVFYNPLSLRCSKSFEKFYSLLDECVFPVKDLEEGKNFHPKLWIVKYKKQQAVVYKLLVTSRNLTFDKSLDYGVWLEGQLFQGSPANKNTGLIQLVKDSLKHVPEMSPNRAGLEKLLKELPRVEFSPPTLDGIQITSPQLHYIKDHESAEESGLFQKWDRILIISPFLAKSTLHRLTKLAAEKYLFTIRPSITYDIFQTLGGNVWLYNSLAKTENMSSGLHAKLYLCEKNKKTSLFVGSANASVNAFNGNREVLLSLQLGGKRDYITEAIEQLLNIKDLFHQYSEHEKQDIPEEAETFTPPSWLEEITGLVKKDGNTYQIILECKNDAPDITLSPLLASNTSLPISKKMIFSQLDVTKLSQFFKAEYKGLGAVIIQIYLKDFPCDQRREELNKELFSNEENLKVLIFSLLTDTSCYTREADDPSKNMPQLDSSYRMAGHHYFSDGIYEALLKKCVDKPDTIKNQIEQILGILKYDSNDSQHNLKNMIQTFKDAFKK